MTATTVDATAPEPTPAASRIWAPAAAFAGVAATAAALGVSELVAGLLGAQSLIAAIGGVVIDNQPPGAKDFVVSIFGTNDKLALEVLIVVVALAIGAGIGLLARRWYTVAAAAIAGFAVIGFAAALGDPSVSAAPQALVAGAGAIAGIWTLSWLIGRAPTAGPSVSAAAGALGMPNWSRRGFLIRSGSIAAASVVAGVVGRNMLESARPPRRPAGPRSRRRPSLRRSHRAASSRRTGSRRSSSRTTSSTGSTPP